MGTAILIGLVVLLVAIAIGAVIIMLATRVAGGFMPKFLGAALVAVIETIVAGIISYCLGLVMGPGSLTSILTLVIVFLVNSAILNAIIKRPDGMQLGFGKACLVTLVQIIIEIVLVILLVLVFGASMLSMVPMH
jgi:hypothetical protein